MTGTATIARHLTQRAVIQLGHFADISEANLIALEASEKVSGWADCDPQVFVDVTVDAG